MANPSRGGEESAGIKLFGATITLQAKKSTEPSKGSSDQLEMKRPDKIIPCPRCKSMETKFCYFNNYNVNQPRHFCKGCQRYWTAGGALRNVPVGAGRRKSKPPLPPCRGLGAAVAGFPENRSCSFDGSDDHHPLSQRHHQDQYYDLECGVLEDWAHNQHQNHHQMMLMMIPQGGLQHVVRVKKRRHGDQSH